MLFYVKVRGGEKQTKTEASQNSFVWNSLIKITTYCHIMYP